MRPTRDSDRLWLRVLGQPGVATLLLCTAAVLVMVGSGWAVVRVLGGARTVIPTLGPEPIIRVRIAARRQQIELTSPGGLLAATGSAIPLILPAPVVIEPDGDGFVLTDAQGTAHARGRIDRRDGRGIARDRGSRVDRPGRRTLPRRDPTRAR